MRALCARIWSDDYVASVFRDWVRDRRGRMWLALVGDRVAGIAKLTLTGDREAWLHALRVDPRYRRRGIATLLLDHRLARARRLGAGVARLDTSEDNSAVRRLMRRYRFDQLDRFTAYAAPARAVAPPHRGTAAEVAAAWRVARLGNGILNEAFTRRRVRRSDVDRAVRRGLCLVAGGAGGPRAMAIVEPYSGSLRVPYLAGSGRALGELLRALPGEARRRALDGVRIGLPSRLWRIAARAGYRRRWPDAMLVFEKRL